MSAFEINNIQRSRVYVSEITFGYCGVLATTPHIGPASCRSGDLFVAEGGHGVEARSAAGRPKAGGQADRGQNEDGKSKRGRIARFETEDRKSTRLNSSHVAIS